MQLRKDIEGLRGVSVLAVMLFHVGMTGFGGGFVGVDVFFVISGYLIARLLVIELQETGEISLRRFWARRARRLLPNACLTLGTILIAAFFLMPSYLNEAIAAEVAAAALNVSNWLFASKAVDYFLADAAPSPVRHFWSLSIEEQFYFFWPLLLAPLAFVKGRRRTIGAAIATIILVASFAASLHVMQTNQPHAFFHTHTRVWQLAFGSLIAFIDPALDKLPKRSREAMSWIGLIAIGASILSLRETLAYPGFWALIPTCASALVIAGTGKWSASNVLGSPALTWVGRRSYSLYLWHWPVIIFLPMILPAAAEWPILSLAASIIIAWVAYEFVEHPIRTSATLNRAPNLTLVGGAVMVSVVVLGATALASTRFNAATTNEQLALQLESSRKDLPRTYDDRCHQAYEVVTQPDCNYGAPQFTRTAVLFGDSHAAQWFPALEVAAVQSGWRLRTWTKTGCPAAEVELWEEARRTRYVQCAQWRDAVVDRLLDSDQRPDMVIISNLVDYSGAIVDRTGAEILPGPAAANMLRDGMERMLLRLKSAGLRVIVIRDVPAMRRDFAECLAKNDAVGACARPRAEALGGSAPDMVAARRAGVQIIDLTDAICSFSQCDPVQNGRVIYKDRHHLTATFAQTLAPSFRPLFNSEN